MNGLSLFDGSNGGKASNYMLGATSLTRNGLITPRLLTANVTVGKVYEQTTSLAGPDVTEANIVASKQAGVSLTVAFQAASAGTGRR